MIASLVQPSRLALRLAPVSVLSMSMRDYALDFLAPRGVIPAPLTFSRNSGAVAFPGGVPTEYAANIPAIEASGLVLEGSRTNTLTQVRGTTWGVAVGGGASGAIGPSGLIEDAQTFVENTATSQHYLSHTTSVATTNGVTYFASILVKPGTSNMIQWAIGGGFNNSNVWANFDLSGAGAVGRIGTNTTGAGIIKVGNWYWIWIAGPALLTGTTGSVFTPQITTLNDVRAPSYLGTGRSVVIGWRWLEGDVAFPSTPVIPAYGGSGPATRARTNCTALLNAMGVPNNARGTYLFSGRIPYLGANSCLFDLNDGTGNNRLALMVDAAGSVVAKRTLAGSSANSAAAGTVTAGVNFRAGLTMPGDGTAIVSFGGVQQTVTGGPTSGFTQVRAGNAVSGEDSFLRLYAARILRDPVTGDAFNNAINAMPLAA